VAGRGKFVLDGVPRMRERPIQDLVDGLTGLGVDVRCTLGTGCPPVEINAQGIRPGKVGTLIRSQHSANLRCERSERWSSWITEDVLEGKGVSAL
jgi:5-enolpyruvylshikimate-3-phosphate synthase